MSNIVLRKGMIVFVNDDNEKEMGVQSGTRPYLVISNRKFLEHSPVFNCVPLTTKKKKFSPVHYFLSKDKVEIPRNSIVLCEQIHTISKDKIDKIICILPDEIINEINKLILFQLSL